MLYTAEVVEASEAGIKNVQQQHRSGPAKVVEGEGGEAGGEKVSETLQRAQIYWRKRNFTVGMTAGTAGRKQAAQAHPLQGDEPAGLGNPKTTRA